MFCGRFRDGTCSAKQRETEVMGIWGDVIRESAIGLERVRIPQGSERFSNLRHLWDILYTHKLLPTALNW